MRLVRSLALIAPLMVLGHAEPARAAGNGGGDAIDVLVIDPMIAIDGGAVLTFAVLDLDRHRGTAYGITELSYNFAIAQLTRDLALDGDGDGDGVSAPLLTAAAIHGALAVDGVVQLGESRRWRPRSTVAVAGLTASLDWFLDGADPPTSRGEGYGKAEVLCNGPLFAGFAYITIDELRDGHYGRGALATTGWAMSAALIGDGMQHVMAGHDHHHLPSLAPTIVDGGGDGRGADLALGLGTHGRW